MFFLLLFLGGSTTLLIFWQIYKKHKLYFKVPLNYLRQKWLLNQESRGIKTVLTFTFNYRGKEYIYIVKNERRYSMREISIVGSTSGKIYNFHPSFIPPINAKDVGEEFFKITIDNIEMGNRQTLEKFFQN